MNTPALQTKFTVTSGTSREPSKTFPWGNGVETFAVGSQGDWRVFGDGVLGVHFYLRFDGRMAHIALASPDARVLLKGQALAPGWHPVPVLSNVEFGSARLHVVCEEQSAAPPSPHRPSAHVLVDRKCIVMEPPGLGRTRPIASPAPVSQSPLAAPGLAVRQEHPPAALNRLESAPPALIREEHAPVPIARHEHAPVPAVRSSADPHGARVLGGEWSTLIDGGALREYARRVADASADSARVHARAYASEVRTRGSSSHPPDGTDSPPFGVTKKSEGPNHYAPGAEEHARPAGNQPSSAPPPEDGAPPASGPPPSGQSRLGRAWRETSHVKKLVALMLPLLGWVVLQEPETTAQPVSVEISRTPRTAPSALLPRAAALPAASGAPPPVSSDRPAISVPPVRIPVPATAPEKLATTTATFAAPGPSPVNGLGSSPAERGALDALFEGKLAAASALYATLAGEHPSSPVFGLAARMVRERAVRKP